MKALNPAGHEGLALPLAKFIITPAALLLSSDGMVVIDESRIGKSE